MRRQSPGTWRKDVFLGGFCRVFFGMIETLARPRAVFQPGGALVHPCIPKPPPPVALSPVLIPTQVRIVTLVTTIQVRALNTRIHFVRTQRAPLSHPSKSPTRAEVLIGGGRLHWTPSTNHQLPIMGKWKKYHSASSYCSSIVPRAF